MAYLTHYQPVTCVWEVTMGCNMNCGHCGSSCAAPLPGELTTDEAYGLIDQIAALGVRWATLSGGEPTTRKDLPLLIKRLRERGVSANIITNGWLMDERMALELKDSGIYTVAISIDGTEKIHDSIRREGSFARSKAALSILKEKGIKTGIVTTVSKLNISILPELRKELIEMGADSWQLQIGLPMGNMAERPDWLIEPEQVNDIIDFCLETSTQGEIIIFPADCIGYYTEKEMRIRENSFKTDNITTWDGCNAGVRSFGILHNGDILGCTSIRDREYIEGNIKETGLMEIWHRPSGFKWRRAMMKKDLSGVCAECIYGSKCLGGCPNTRLTMNGTIHSENQYCAYNVAVKKRRTELEDETSVAEMLNSARLRVGNGEFQDVALVCERIIELDPGNVEVYALKGYAEFMCGNYELSEKANQKYLEFSPSNPEAMKGLGLALHRQGRSDEGLKLLENAAKATGYTNQDIMHDLAVVRGEMR